MKPNLVEAKGILSLDHPAMLDMSLVAVAVVQKVENPSALSFPS
jgi:hypothetical protein